MPLVEWTPPRRPHRYTAANIETAKAETRSSCIRILSTHVPDFTSLCPRPNHLVLLLQASRRRARHDLVIVGHLAARRSIQMSFENSD